MHYRGIALSVVVVAMSLMTCEALGVLIYFDADSDFLPDTEYTMKAGEEVLVSLCLSDFTEETGSFQVDIFYDGQVISLLDYDTYKGQPDEDPGLTGPIQTKAELGPWGTSQWSVPVTQEVNEFDPGSGKMREFYAAGSFTETASGDGIVAYLVFEATSYGQTTLELEMPGGTWFLEDVAEQPVVTNIIFYVIPEPSMLALMFTVLPLLFIKGRSRT